MHTILIDTVSCYYVAARKTHVDHVLHSIDFAKLVAHLDPSDEAHVVGYVGMGPFGNKEMIQALEHGYCNYETEHLHDLQTVWHAAANQFKPSFNANIAYQMGVLALQGGDITVVSHSFGLYTTLKLASQQVKNVRKGAKVRLAFWSDFIDSKFLGKINGFELVSLDGLGIIVPKEGEAASVARDEFAANKGVVSV
jgi:hypothetical protein